MVPCRRNGPSSTTGGATCLMTSSNNGFMPSSCEASGVVPILPCLPEPYRIGKSSCSSVASSAANRSNTSLTTSVTRASGRSTLLIATIGLRPSLSALPTTNLVCGIGPSAASTSTITPSTIDRMRSTSPPKSAWPGVSTMLIWVSPQCTEVHLARMVMPRSFSRSLESIARSATRWFSRYVPDCCSSLSTRVVLPWSTCAMIAILRRFINHPGAAVAAINRAAKSRPEKEVPGSIEPGTHCGAKKLGITQKQRINRPNGRVCEKCLSDLSRGYGTRPPGLFRQVDQEHLPVGDHKIKQFQRDAEGRQRAFLDGAVLETMQRFPHDGVGLGLHGVEFLQRLAVARGGQHFQEPLPQARIRHALILAQVAAEPRHHRAHHREQHDAAPHVVAVLVEEALLLAIHERSGAGMRGNGRILIGVGSFDLGRLREFVDDNLPGAEQLPGKGGNRGVGQRAPRHEMMTDSDGGHGVVGPRRRDAESARGNFAGIIGGEFLSDGFGGIEREEPRFGARARGRCDRFRGDAAVERADREISVELAVAQRLGNADRRELGDSHRPR